MSLSTVKNLQVLYEDNHLIAVNKRSSDLVQGDKSGDTPISEVVKEWLKIKYDKPGKVYLGVVHRLDRPVSGVLLFGKTSKASARLSEQFRSREMQKTYWAIVKAKPQSKNGHLHDWLRKNQDKNKSFVTQGRGKEAKESKLDYSLLLSSDRYHLLEINPITGRHHQIRVQLSNMGSPIKGDLKYGFDRSNKDGSISLHARQLQLIHPVKKEAMRILAPVPEDVLWKSFERSLTKK